jgi:CRISPR-associated protein Cas5d
MTPTTYTLEVWGELGCFTRPEAKGERFSYPVITPSAARGIFDAIFVKPPEFRWQVTRVEVLAEPAYITLRRNEVKEKINLNAVHRWMAGKAEPEPLWADGDRELTRSDEKGRTQRQTLALRKPRFRISARISPWPGHEARLVALQRQFERRARQGKCFHQPYLGCREFPAYFELVEPGSSGDGGPLESVNLDLGYMLYDVFDLSRPGSPDDSPAISLFPARVEAGVMEVPPWDDPAVLKVPLEASR